MKYIVNTRRMSRVYMDDESGSGRELFTDEALVSDGLIIDIEDTDESHVFVVYEKSENSMSMRVFYDVQSVIDFINSHDEIVARVSLFYTCDDMPVAKFIIKKNGVATESKVMVDTEYDDELEVIKELHNTFARSTGEIKGYVVGYVDDTGKVTERTYKVRDKVKVNNRKAYKFEVKDKNGVIAGVDSIYELSSDAKDLGNNDILEHDYTIWRTFYTVIDDMYDDVLKTLTDNADLRCE